MEIEADDIITQWMIRWAAMMTSRFLVGCDGMTSWERRTGRKCNIEVVPFGEVIHYKEIKDSRKEKTIWMPTSKIASGWGMNVTVMKSFMEPARVLSRRTPFGGETKTTVGTLIRSGK